MKFKLVVSMVKTQYTDQVVDAAKVAGGTGATIISARGTGIHEAKTFFGLTLETQTDVILLLLAEALVDPVIRAIHDAGKFSEPGTGIAFVLDAEQVVGLKSQVDHFRREEEHLT